VSYIPTSDHQQEPTREQRLASALLADRNRIKVERTDVVRCFTCGYGMIYRGSRFCSERCRDFYDAGNAPLSEQKIVYRFRDGRPMQETAKGLRIPCAHCRRDFESLGVRCCSIECERRYRERKDNLAIMAEVGMEAAPPKRTCAGCGERIPMWRKGRRVSSATRFCSPKCGAKYARKARVASESQDAVL
jgi:predicted nucleic acid-binding Zn ribbon protein